MEAVKRANEGGNGGDKSGGRSFVIGHNDLPPLLTIGASACL
jgi:hypothetical protein